MTIKYAFLDLDETLVHSIGYDEMRLLPRDFLSLPHHQMADCIVFERPGLALFLREMAAHAQLFVWTAGTRNYALDIIQRVLNPKLPPGKKIEFFLSRDHCTKSQTDYNVLKHLDFIGRSFGICDMNRHNTLIVDDNEGILGQNNIVIHARRFTVDTCPRGDTELADVYARILRFANWKN